MANPGTDEEHHHHTLLRAALEAAIARLNNAGSDPEKAFAAIGEVAFWVVAADDSVSKGTTPAYKERREASELLPLFQGMRYPRNGTTHELTAWEQTHHDPTTERFWSEYGAWVWSRLPAPVPGDRRRPEQYKAYQERLEGHAVLDTAADALDELISWWDTREPE